MNPSITGSSLGDNKISGYKLNQLSTLTPQQEQLFSRLLGGTSEGTERGLGFLSNLAGGNNAAFEQMERPAYAGFDKLLGQIGSRYAQAGALGSSSFQNAVAGAGSELSQNLQAQRSAIQMQALERLLGLSSGLLGQRSFENILTQKPQSNKRGVLGQLLGSVLPSLLSDFGGGVGGSLASLFSDSGQQQGLSSPFNPSSTSGLGEWIQ